MARASSGRTASCSPGSSTSACAAPSAAAPSSEGMWRARRPSTSSTPSTTPPPPRPPPTSAWTFTATSRPAISGCGSSSRTTSGGLLCDDMGLGKTHQAMALIRALTRVTKPSILIVCPTSVLDHWREKLARYIPEVRFDVHHGSGRAVKEETRTILTSYGVVRSDFAQLRGRKFDLVILDEIQTIKNPQTATHQALRAIEGRIVIGLTGTPVENHERELKALLDFVVPGYLPPAISDRAALQRLVRPFVLRRTKAQVLTELPPKIVDKRTCELSAHQKALYRQVIESRAKPLQAQLRAGSRIPYIHVFAALNYLKQVCNHPASVGGGLAMPDGESGKWDVFTGLVDECLTSGLKVVVFSQYLP
ncbi:MAG TPA: SNF2-related protein, partial [Thermoanaerobaculia bacterium]|nr:SNF2-related protein [Thermoanaerobaculia bacterium]